MFIVAFEINETSGYDDEGILIDSALDFGSMKQMMVMMMMAIQQMQFS